MPSDGFAFDRYSAASAIWIGLSGTVILPLYFELYRTLQLFGAGFTFFVL